MTDTLKPSPQHHYHFVTGKLAEIAVREVVSSLARKYSFDYSIGVMPITVAALMTPRWLRRHVDVPDQATHVIVPGYCDQGLNELSQSFKKPVICGPKDCRNLGELFGEGFQQPQLDQYQIRIIAEINHVPRLTIEQVVEQAKALQRDGADMVDIGCEPSTRCTAIGDYVSAVRNEGIAVSIDSFDRWEVEQSLARGASLVLSVNSANRNAAVDWGCEVVVIPDAPSDEKSLHKTVDFLASRNVPLRIDPILEPIGAGFAASLTRYAAVRDVYPEAEMMMGIGNLTELTDVDSAGVNLLLLGICEELGIRSVLTTQVINWARSSVRECDAARRLVHYSVKNGVPPKRISNALLMLRDCARLSPYSESALAALADSLKDNNYRIFAQDGQLHLLSAAMQISDSDPYRLFEALLQQPISDNVDPGHAFYLGFEMAKASIALSLGKQYSQDQPLDWGLLTTDEDHHRLQRTSRHRQRNSGESKPSE